MGNGICLGLLNLLLSLLRGLYTTMIHMLLTNRNHSNCVLLRVLPCSFFLYVFNSFPIIYTMTKGAPANKTDTLITYLYMLNFYDRKKGPATALSVIGFVILCICAGIYMVTVMRKEEEE